MMKLPRSLVLILVLSLTLTACNINDLFGNFDVTDEIMPSEDTLVMGFAEALNSYSPLTYDTANRRYMANIYEPLVRYDSNFNFVTGLAVSWGRYDAYTWTFRIREGVYFHDGSTLDADDVVYSFDLAMNKADSELASLLAGIVSVEKTAQDRIQIVTDSLDPLLLHRMTVVYIVPDGKADFSTPIGTGPYYISAYEDGNLFLDRFDDYWGNEPYFASVEMTYLPDAEDRYDSLINGKIDFLVNVPPQYVESIREQGFGVYSFPSLEVSFLMMSMNGVFKDENLRAAVWNVVNAYYGDQLGAGYLTPTHQFAATGIAGYKDESVKRNVNVELAKEFRALHEGRVQVTLDLPFGLEDFGTGVQTDLERIDVQVDLNYLKPEDLSTKILNGESDFYFFGWKYDLADSLDFYDSVIKTGSRYNGISYSNPTIDNLIKDVSATLDGSIRLLLLKKIGEELLSDRVVLPLFESHVLFSTQPDVNWAIRLDGQVLASEIMRFMVQ